MNDDNVTPLEHTGDHFQLDIPDDPQSLRGIRLRVADAISDLAPLPHLTDIVIVVSELVANALLHGAAPRRLSLDLDDRSLRITITDGGTSDITRHTRNPHGYGLHVVAQLAEEWDAVSDSDGTRVWCRMALPDRDQV